MVPKKLAPPELVEIFEKDKPIELPAWVGFERLSGLTRREESTLNLFLTGSTQFACLKYVLNTAAAGTVNKTASIGCV